MGGGRGCRVLVLEEGLHPQLKMKLVGKPDFSELPMIKDLGSMDSKADIDGFQGWCEDPMKVLE